MAPKNMKRCCFYGPTKKGQVVVKCIDFSNMCNDTLSRGGVDLPQFAPSTGPVANCGDCKKKAPAGLEGYTLVFDDEDEV